MVFGRQLNYYKVHPGFGGPALGVIPGRIESSASSGVSGKAENSFNLGDHISFFPVNPCEWVAGILFLNIAGENSF
jgi:hypothetical protein